MKVLQTIGSSGQGNAPTAFFYRRQLDSVYTEEPGTGHVHEFTDRQWKEILKELHASSGSFSLSGGLYNLLDRAADNAGINHWQTTEKAKIAAILEHEGSIDHCGNINAPINLISDI